MPTNKSHNYRTVMESMSRRNDCDNMLLILFWMLTLPILVRIVCGPFFNSATTRRYVHGILGDDDAEGYRLTLLKWNERTERVVMHTSITLNDDNDDDDDNAVFEQLAPHVGRYQPGWNR
mmetsp:Transcript_30536/g.46772  ORF Transcript_30536/g.46772 Transcript_30536/m.46772 type:complete len:120 (+) Transcript_30536:162-521(+)